MNRTIAIACMLVLLAPMPTLAADLVIGAPDTVLVGESFVITITADGSPVEGANVICSLGGAQFFLIPTNADGMTVLIPTTTGELLITAIKSPEHAQGHKTIMVVESIVETGTGTVSFTLDSGLLSSIQSTAEAELPQEVLDNKPEGFALPHGIFTFAITGLTPGASVTVTITLPAPVPVGTHWWKVNTTAGNNTWYSLQIGDDDGDNVITITLTDGGAGDHDGVVNGVILDPGGPGWAPVHNRETGLNYTTIQAAIDDANTTDGHTLTVDPGIYNENVQVSKSLILHSTSGDCTNTIVNASDAGKHVFEITVDSVHLSGFGIENATGAWKAGIFFGSGVNDCNVTNNSVESNYYGISLSGASGNNVSCNWVHHNDEAGFYLTGGSVGNTIEQNNIVANGVYNETTGGWGWNVYNDQANAIEAKNNYWVAVDNETIDASICDDDEDGNKGRVAFYPPLDGESPCAPIPELATAVLFAVGLLMLVGCVCVGFTRRRRE